MRYTISAMLASLTVSAAPAEVPAVVTDIPPVHALVSQVMGDLGAPVLLLDRGADAHAFQLRPSQARAVAGAGLAVWMGEAMSPWMARALEGTGSRAVSLELLEAEGTRLRRYGGAGADGGDGGRGHGADGSGHDGPAEGHDGHGHAAAGGPDHGHGHGAGEEHAHDHGQDHGHGAGHDHGHGGTDPHAWLDPGNAGVWLGLVAVELARLDPDNAAAYAANAAAAAAALASLEAEVAAILAPVRDRPFVTFHDAYGYFVQRFGLNQAGAIALGDAAAPGAARLSGLRRTAADGGAICVFPEANHDPRLAAQLAEAAGARLGPVLDPEGASLDPGPGLYAALMTGLAGRLAECLSAP